MEGRPVPGLGDGHPRWAQAELGTSSGSCRLSWGATGHLGAVLEDGETEAGALV